MLSLKRTRTGFTLIELLVVIAIIALLIAILLPSLSAAKQEGMKAKCLANLKGIGSSAVAYSVDDSTGKFIPEHPLLYSPSSPSLGFFEYGGNDGQPGSLWASNGAIGGAGQRPLNKFTAVYKDLDGTGGVNDRSGFALYECPQDQGFISTPSTPADDYAPGLPELAPTFSYFGNSYQANCLYLIGNNQVLYRGPMLRPQSRIPNTGNTVGFLEARLWETPWNSKANPYGAGGQAVTIRGWHGKLGLFNAAMCDGSARTVSAKAEDYFNNLAAPANQAYRMRARDFQWDCYPSEEIALIPITNP